MPVETRYMRNDEVLGTTNTTTYDYAEAAKTANMMGIRVYHNNTEITGGVCVALVNPDSTPSWKSATWNCPQTALGAGEKVKVEVWCCTPAGVPDAKIQTFLTEVLGAQSLDFSTWTVYYYCWQWVDPETGIGYMSLWYGSATYNSRIENFAWTSAAPPPAVKAGLQISEVIPLIIDDS